MAYKFREEIVGKRFLSVSGFTKLKVNKISEWGWRAGVIRAASHRDNGCHDLQYLTGHHCRSGGFLFSGFSVSKNAIVLLGSQQTYRRDFSYKSFHCFNAFCGAPAKEAPLYSVHEIYEVCLEEDGNAVTQDGWKVHWPVKNLGEGESVG
ncbi:hypothetical protein ALC62_11072 [Cyphomyrmex costatus]|uniref:DUF7030 domain-containing protein n=1 Tax=Cyphomyrmex costatus TaxID=456900 RepID=A0A151ICV6_9HYME|nr:hypothetical protein ALC62_11072 [Cyphomyrmex costatus]